MGVRVISGMRGERVNHTKQIALCSWKSDPKKLKFSHMFFVIRIVKEEERWDVLELLC
jgi:hypothetical protein